MYLFVNAYIVTRQYGGSEEGGWWYDVGNPAASMPVKAKKAPGHAPNHCFCCDEAREGRGEFCLEESSPEEMEDCFFEWLTYRREQLPHDQRLALIDAWRHRFRKWEAREAIEKSGFEDSPEYRRGMRQASHLTPEDPNVVERIKREIRRTLEGEAFGDIGSVLGGQAVQVCVEEKMAEFWPQEKPRYE